MSLFRGIRRAIIELLLLVLKGLYTPPYIDYCAALNYSDSIIAGISSIVAI